MRRGARVIVTKKLVLAATPPAGRRSLYLWDAEVKGFGVRIRAAQGDVSRTYVIKYRTGKRGKKKIVHIGTHDQAWRPDPLTGEGRKLGPELARDEAVRLLGHRVDGRDPAAMRNAPLMIPTLRAFVLEAGTDDAPRYLSHYVDVDKAPASAVADRGNLENHLLPQFGNVRLDLIGAEHFAALKKAMKDTPIAANRCRALLSHILTQARVWRVLPRDYVNPARDVKRYPEHGRERILSVQELARVGVAMLAEEAIEPTNGARPAISVAAIRVMMFSGARPVEVLSLRRAQLRTLSSGVIMQESRKTARKRRPLYLSPLAVDVLIDLWPRPWPPGRSDWVFPGRLKMKDQPLSIAAVDGVWERIRARAKVEDVRLYDAARHTFLTMTMLLAKSPAVVQALAGHASVRMTDRYIHLAADPLLRASGETAAALDRALRGETKTDS